MTRPLPHRLALVPLTIACVLGAAGCANTRPGADDTASKPGTTTCSYPVSGEPSKPVDPPQERNVPATGTTTAVLTFPEGAVTLTLNQAGAPCAVNSFVSLAQQGWFTGTACHRLVDQGIFILQCGDPTGSGTGGPGYTFADELTGKETYPKGTVAMENRGKDTNGSQFFLVWADSPLPAQYTVFGTMDAQGLQVVGRMAAQGVAAGAASAPIADTTISQVTLG